MTEPLATASSAGAVLRNGHLNLDTFSPVNQHGSFEFDRVLKRGKVYRRSKSKHAFTASWKPAYLVLRPNLLSVYKDEEEAGLRLSINLSDITAVAAVKPRRSKRDHIFGIFSPSKNHRFQALSAPDAEAWIEAIRREARLDEAEEEAFLVQHMHRIEEEKETPPYESVSEMSDYEGRSRDHGRRSSSPVVERTRSFSGPHGQKMRRSPSYLQDFSGNEVTSYSDFSDTPGPPSLPRLSTASLPRSDPSVLTPTTSPAVKKRPSLVPVNQPNELVRTVSSDPERVIWQGYLHCLRSKRGVRQWKKLWVVLRPKKLTFYKDNQEYSAVKILNMDQVITASEIDPVSRSKKFCLQIIAEHKTYRFCAPDEESLARWLGALKTVLVRQRQEQRVASADSSGSVAAAVGTAAVPVPVPAIVATPGS